MDTLKRLNAEKDFYNHFYKGGWEKQDQFIDESIVPSNMSVYWNLLKSHVNDLKAKHSQSLFLDCGCGHGVLSVLLGKIDAQVVAVDISHYSTTITNNLAKVNGVGQKIHVVVAALEHLPFKHDTFYSVLGTRVLHHVDIDNSSRELSRVVKPNAKVFFWECTENNPVLRFARNNIRSILPIPKFGTEYEHPLTKDEIAVLETSFGNPVTIVRAPFYFFSLINQYLSRKYVEQLTNLGEKLDTMLAKVFPNLNRFSFHQILVFKKNQKK